MVEFLPQTGIPRPNNWTVMVSADKNRKRRRLGHGVREVDVNEQKDTYRCQWLLKGSKRPDARKLGTHPGTHDVKKNDVSKTDDNKSSAITQTHKCVAWTNTIAIHFFCPKWRVRRVPQMTPPKERPGLDHPDHGHNRRGAIWPWAPWGPFGERLPPRTDAPMAAHRSLSLTPYMLTAHC